MNLPNKLTILRIILSFAFIIFLFSKGLTAKTIALFIFLLAAVTDALDGFLAKRNNQITEFGKLMDPIADKILVLSAFLGFVEMKAIPAWMFIVVISREVAVTGLRITALSKGKVLAADGGGKQKMIMQVVSIFVILLYLIFKEGGQPAFGFWTTDVESVYKNAIFILMLITVAMTLASGVSYLVKNKEVYSNAKKS